MAPKALLAYEERLARRALEIPAFKAPPGYKALRAPRGTQELTGKAAQVFRG